MFRLSNDGDIVQLGQWNEADPLHHELMRELVDDARQNSKLFDPRKMGGNSSILVPLENTGGAYTAVRGRFPSKTGCLPLQWQSRGKRRFLLGNACGRTTGLRTRSGCG
jgi:hypothetical protein